MVAGFAPLVAIETFAFADSVSLAAMVAGGLSTEATSILLIGVVRSCAAADGRGGPILGTLFVWLNHKDMKSSFATDAAALVLGNERFCTACFRKVLLAARWAFTSLLRERCSALLFARADCFITARAAGFADSTAPVIPDDAALPRTALTLRGVRTPAGRGTARGVPPPTPPGANSFFGMSNGRHLPSFSSNDLAAAFPPNGLLKSEPPLRGVDDFLPRGVATMRSTVPSTPRCQMTEGQIRC